MKRIFSLIATALLTTLAAGAQDLDLNEPAIADLQLDYGGKTIASVKASYYRDLTFWNLFGMRLTGWNGGYGCYSTPLPDGNTFWSFGESTFGRISEFRDRKQYNNAPHNAAMIQVGGEVSEEFVTLNEYVTTDRTTPKKLFMGKTWMRHPDATAVNDYNLGNGKIDTDHWYHPGDAHVVNRNGKAVLQVIFFGYSAEQATEPNEIALAEYALDGTPGDGQYMQLIAFRPHHVPFRANYGQRILEDGEHVYLYGTTQATTLLNTGATVIQPAPVVARTTWLDLGNPWEYYIAGDDGTMHWQTEVPTVEQVRRSAIAGANSLETPNVFRYDSLYYMVSLTEVNGVLAMYHADTPWGPFSSKKQLCRFPTDQKDCCDVFVHPQLSRMGELVVSYNSVPESIVLISPTYDGKAFEKTVAGPDRLYNGWGSANLNVPHFVRIFDWQNVYKVEDTGALTDAGLESFATAIDGPVADAAPTFSVYPTVATSTISIDAPHDCAYDWSISTLQGIVMLSGNAMGSTTLDVSSLPEGIGIVTVQTQGQQWSTKIIKR